MISDCGKGFVLDAISELAKQVKDQGGPTVQGVVTAVSSAALSAVFTALDWGPVLQAIRSFGDRSPGVVSQVVAALKPHFDQVRSDIAQGRVDPVAERAIRLRIEMELDLRQPRMEAVVSAMTEFLAALENAVQRFPFEVMPLGQKLCGVALASIYTLIDRERDVAPDRAQWPVFAKQLRHIVGLFAKAFELMFDTAREVFKRTPIHPEATFAGRVADEMGNRLGTTSTSMFEAHANRVLANGCPRLLRRQDQGGESGIEWRLANEFPEGAIPLEFAGVQGLGQQVGEFSRYARELARWGSDPQKPKGVQSEPAQRWRGRMHELGVEESRDSVRKQLVPFIRALDNMLAANTLLRVEHSFAFSAAAAGPAAGGGAAPAAPAAAAPVRRQKPRKVAELCNQLGHLQSVDPRRAAGSLKAYAKDALQADSSLLPVLQQHGYPGASVYNCEDLLGAVMHHYGDF